MLRVVILNMMAELDLTMGLAGVTSIPELSTALLAHHTESRSLCR